MIGSTLVIECTWGAQESLPAALVWRQFLRKPLLASWQARMPALPGERKTMGQEM
jgi:hypothetical protein